MPKKNYILLFLVFSNLFVFSQVDGVKQKDVWMNDNIFLDGLISDYYTGKSISGVNITASAEGKTIAKGTSDGKGEYKLVLEYDKIYTITFSKTGFTSKIITMNTNGVPDIKREKVPDMGAEITLFKPNDCIKSDMMNTPIGRAIYFPKKNVMDWDMEYSMPRLAKLNKMLEKCADEAEEKAAEEEQKENDYNTAMKEANKAFSKDNYDEAITSYKKAIALFNDRPEPKTKLQLIETELAKKAEVEKQQAEEKARAEAEKIATAKAEAAAKKAEQERIAKEKAKQEVLAKAAAEEIAKKEAQLAAKKAKEEQLAKEQAKAEKEIAAKKEAEQKAKEQEKKALAKAKTENEAKSIAQKEVEKRAEAEENALKDKLIAEKEAEKEKKAKELAAQLAKKAEKERVENQVVLQETKKEVIAKIVTQEKQKATLKIIDDFNKKETNGSASIKFKKKSKTRHLYQKPNKHRKGKGPQPKKRIVF